MENTALLTDDEIVALCAADGRPWPIGLNTVATNVEELAQAGIRGMRSLMVRRLAGGDAERSGVRPHEMIARDVAAFLDATERIGVYLAPASDHSALGGASITAARAGDEWVVDTATAAGVHALRKTTAEDAAGAILELAEKAYTGDLFGDGTEGQQRVCVVQLDSAGRNVIAITTGSVTGHINGNTVEAWDPALIRAAFEQP